jgi:DNA-binding response OmpR family regulator
MTPIVLVCDDEAPLRELVRATLEDVDCEVAQAADGEEALRQARALRPSVILLDTMMPGKTGLDVASELRADPQFAETALVSLSGRTQVTDREAAARSGTDYFLPKPFSIGELLALVTRLLEERPRRAG